MPKIQIPVLLAAAAMFAAADAPADDVASPEANSSSGGAAVTFGAIADCQYCDGPLKGVRYYRDSPAKLRAAVAELDRYEAWLALLGYVAQAAPLFGLLGTVIGMVDLFSSMQMAGSDVSTATLSAGIWKALLTTAAGLIVAIPTLGVHLWLTRRLELLQHRMEEGVGRLLSRAAA